jgi:hypothetical protein
MKEPRQRLQAEEIILGISDTDAATALVLFFGLNESELSQKTTNGAGKAQGAPQRRYRYVVT